MALPMLAIVPPWRIPSRFWGGLISRVFMEPERGQRRRTVCSFCTESSKLTASRVALVILS